MRPAQQLRRLLAGWLNGGLRIISLPVLALTAVLLLPACSTMRLAYNQAPELAYWYLDGYLDFNETQSRQVRADLARLLAWHRQTQLPSYIDLLQKLQPQLRGDISAAQACVVFADVRRKLMQVSDQAEPLVSSLATSLQPAQLQHMERKFAKVNEEYRDDFLDDSPAEIHKTRLKQAVKRAEMLYGSLTAAQEKLVGQLLEQSVFDADRTYAERLRRQQDALKTLRQLMAEGSTAERTANSAEKARPAIRALFERSLNSPDAAWRDYAEKLTQDNCHSFAEIHRSTSAAQRQKAVQTLADYEKDLKALLPQNKG